MAPPTEDPATKLLTGKPVFLTEEYYKTHNLTVLDVPRYGWLVKEVTQGIAILEYQRKNLKLRMCLTVDIKYLKIEL